MNSKWQQISLAGKVYLICVFLSIFFLVIGNALMYRTASDSLRHEVREKIEAVARTAASQIDVQAHERVCTRTDESSESYRNLKNLLIEIKKANPDIRYVYTMRKTAKKGVLQFVVDAEQDPELLSHVGDEFAITDCPDMAHAFNEPTSDRELTTDKWGTWLSGYAPIRDEKGKTVGIVGLDMSVQQLRLEESQLRVSWLRNLIVSGLLALIVSLIITRALLKPVRIITDAAQRVRSGDLSVKVNLGLAPEVAQFAEAFNGMVDGLRQSTRDLLTGLCNHRSFHEALDVEIARAERYGRDLCLLFLVIDHFKDVNETFGHPVGDCILRQVSDVIRGKVRGVDIPARYGGDEFAIILPESDSAAGAILAERIRVEIDERKFFAVSLDEMLSEDFDSHASETVSVTVTVGIASLPPHLRTREGLVMAADISLCRAKHLGRNCICQYESASDENCQMDPQDVYKMLHEPDAAAIRSLAAAVEAKDRYTHGHSERVTEYSLIIADAIGMGTEQVDNLKVAGLLHDLGKIGVPDAILNKSVDLTQDEWEILRSHPVVGGNILRRAPQLNAVVPAVVSHHERWDGTGYPDGLKGEEIPLLARILAIADSFDAMTSDRPYRSGMSDNEALLELLTNAGKQFDPDLVSVFISSMASKSPDVAA